MAVVISILIFTISLLAIIFALAVCRASSQGEDILRRAGGEHHPELFDRERR
jgi:hypothetical protein